MTLGAQLALPDPQPCPHTPAQAALAPVKPFQHLQGELQVGTATACPLRAPHPSQQSSTRGEGNGTALPGYGAVHSIQEHPTSPPKIAPAASPSAI